MQKDDAIGVVREHRWMTAEDQARILRPDCRAIATFYGGRFRRVTLEDLAKLTRPGTVLNLVHAFLLAEPGPTREMKASLRHAFELLTVEREGIIRDVTTGMSTETKAKRQALIDMASVQIGRSNQGAESATNGTKSQGAQPLDVSPEQLRDAKAVWRDQIEYPEWEDAARGLRAVHSNFTVWRAHKLWGPRQSKR